jgi:hypothetical protein
MSNKRKKGVLPWIKISPGIQGDRFVAGCEAPAPREDSIGSVLNKAIRDTFS